MKKFESIRNLALGNFGLVTVAQAKEFGVRSFELARWMKMGWLEHSARGVYRVSDFPPSRYDSFAALTEAFGPKARIVGESVLGMLELTSTSPQHLHVGVPGRVRRAHDDGVVLSVVDAEDPIEYYEGVRSQSVLEAIRSCRGKIVPSRLREAADAGWRKGYLNDREYRTLKREIGK